MNLDLRDGKNTDFFLRGCGWEDMQGPVVLREAWARLPAVGYRTRQYLTHAVWGAD